ncbi:MAG: squalene synthase HpnC [Elusimicrobia bacterium]|nr:squalene synthase HpnC [Elusimicrobiota bacterium]
MTTLEESFRFCENLAKKHYENFPVGSFLVPKEKRKYVWAIYAFARTADDFADEGRFKGETLDDIKKRLNQLDEWEVSLDSCISGRSDHPIFIALSETISKLALPPQLLKDLLTAYRMDVEKNRYKNFEEVLYYCKHSANPVGRLVLTIFGYQDRALHQLSDHICTALQLTNFWQDIAIDFKKDRIYLPQDQMLHFGVSEEDLKKENFNESFKKLLYFCSQKTSDLFNQGLPLTELVGKDLRIEMKLTWLGGTAILRKIEERDYNVFKFRPVITWKDKFCLLLRSLSPKPIAPYRVLKP